MIVYFDTSAFVPLLVDESSTPLCQRLWQGADTLVASRLLFIEASAALHQAHRFNRISRRTLKTAITGLNDLWSVVDVVEIDEPLMQSAAGLAGRHGLRGYDVAHCAAGLLVGADGDAVLASGDQTLLAAWASEQLTTCDINQPLE